MTELKATGREKFFLKPPSDMFDWDLNRPLKMVSVIFDNSFHRRKELFRENWLALQSKTYLIFFFYI